MKLVILFLCSISWAGDEGGTFNGGGGGNFDKASRASFSEFSNISEDVFSLLPHLLDGIDHRPVSPIKKLDAQLEAQLLGEQGYSVSVRALEKVKLKIKEKGACKDPKGNNRDASASSYGANSGSICLSYERISKKFSGDSLWPKLAGILMHEFSHLRGVVKEEVAQEFGDWIEGRVSKQSFTEFEARQAEAKSRVSRIHELFFQAKTKETLTIAHTELMSWLDSGDRDEVAGLGLWSRKEYERIMVLVAQEESLGRWETNEEDESSESPPNLRAFWAGNEHRCEPFCDAVTEGVLFTVTNLDSALKQARAIEKELLLLK